MFVSSQWKRNMKPSGTPSCIAGSASVPVPQQAQQSDPFSERSWGASFGKFKLRGNNDRETFEHL